MMNQSTWKGGEEAGARWLKWVAGVVWFTHSRIKEITGGRAEGDESEVLFGSQADGEIEYIRGSEV